MKGERENLTSLVRRRQNEEFERKEKFLFWLEQLAHHFIDSAEQPYKVIPIFYMKKLKFRQVK